MGMTQNFFNFRFAAIPLQQAYFVKGTCQAAHAGGKVPLSWVRESLAAIRHPKKNIRYI